MTIQNSLNKHGEKKMASRAFESLTEEDLRYLETLLGEAYSKEMNEDRTWQTKNGYARPFQKQRRILNCLNAIRSQKDYLRKTSIKW